jgi:alpha-D-ribose 1-methylphosphonate 5-triphosphate synthase subunit PhnH
LNDAFMGLDGLSDSVARPLAAALLALADFETPVWLIPARSPI